MQPSSAGRRYGGPRRGGDRLIIALEGLTVGAGGARRLGRAGGVITGQRPRLGTVVMMRQQWRELAHPFGVERRQRVGGSPVQFAAAGREDCRLGDVLGERMLEDVRDLVAPGALVEELLPR